VLKVNCASAGTGADRSNCEVSELRTVNRTGDTGVDDFEDASQATRKPPTQASKDKAMKKVSAPIIAAATLAASLLAGSAAALDIDRNVAITDDGGGTLTLVTSGSRDAVGGSSITTATFTGFQPRDDGRIIDGEIVRERERTAEQVETVYHGVLEIRVPAQASEPARLNTIAFENLTVTRSGEGPELSGQIIYNGESRDASEMPRRALRMLRKTLRFFHFA
jgi:hypothetical protein